jgi:hypothetical protein
MALWWEFEGNALMIDSPCLSKSEQSHCTLSVYINACFSVLLIPGKIKKASKHSAQGSILLLAGMADVNVF